MCSIIKCLWVLHFIIYLFRSPSWQSSVLKFVRCSPTHQRPRNELSVGGATKQPARAQLGAHLTPRAACGLSFLLLYPLAQGNHLSLLLQKHSPSHPPLCCQNQQRSFRLGISDSLPEVTRVFPLHVRGQGADMTLVLGNRPSLSFLAGQVASVTLCLGRMFKMSSGLNSSSLALNREGTLAFILLSYSQHPTLPSYQYTIPFDFCLQIILSRCPDGSQLTNKIL